MLKKIPIQSSKTGRSSNTEVNRLISAAIVSRSFCSMLLSDPAKAIAGGYHGEEFHMSSKTVQQVSTIHASNLADFATQLTRY